jgi:hypothetical protein
MRSAWVGILAVTAIVACSSTSSSDGGGGDVVPPCSAETKANDTYLTRTTLGSVHDDDVLGDPHPDTTPGKIDEYFSTHSATDVDWYALDVADTGINGNPRIRVMVTAGFEASAFWSCNSGPSPNATVCGLGTKITSDPEIGNPQGCTTAPANGVPSQTTMNVECDGGDDSGRLAIRVKNLAPSDQCVVYRLQVFVE